MSIEYNWQPDHLIQAYHTRTSSTKAIAFMEKNSPGNDLLLLPSTDGWQAAMGVIRAEQIIEEYPSMLEQPWHKAVALRLKMMTRRETYGRQDKEITYVQMAPMFKPEFEHYDRKIGIRPQTYVEDKLELAPLPAEAKLELAHGYDTSYCGPYEAGRNKHPLERSPAAKLFIAMFKVDLEQQQSLKLAMSYYKNTVRRFMQETKKFYEMTYFHRTQNPKLNLYLNYPDYMEYIRYHVHALMNKIKRQIQNETGEEADHIRSLIKEIRQLIQANENELLKPDEDDSEDESEDEDEEEDEEPIYFTTSPPVTSAGVKGPVPKQVPTPPRPKVENLPTNEDKLQQEVEELRKQLQEAKLKSEHKDPVPEQVPPPPEPPGQVRRHRGITQPIIVGHRQQHPRSSQMTTNGGGMVMRTGIADQ